MDVGRLAAGTRCRWRLPVAVGLCAVVLTTFAAGGRAAAATPPSPLRLHVDGTAIRDGRGRQVVLRGVEVINEQAPFLPQLGPGDFAQLRAWGMNSIRLGILWSALMPSPGRVDPAYLDGISRVVHDAAAAGVYVIIEMHQDLWDSSFGGDGAPTWTDPNSPACPYYDWASYAGTWEANYFSPAVNCAFYQFWTNAQLQAYYAQAWQAVAGQVAGEPMVAGFDLMNEPFSGPIPPGVFETNYLYPSELRWLAAIRKADSAALGFLEPPITENVGAPVLPATGLPRGVVYAPHLYGLWEFTKFPTQARDELADENFNYSAAAARAMGVPLWLGEFSVDYGNNSDQSFVPHEYSLVDGARASACFWSYGSLRSSMASGSPLVSEVVRPSPAAVAGTITSFSFDVSTKTFTVTWQQEGPQPSEVAVPVSVYPHGFALLGATHWSYDRSSATVVIWGAQGSNSIRIVPSS